MKKALKLLIILALLGSVSFFAMYWYIDNFSKNAKPEKSDVILVLGCQTWGREPSWSLEYRLQKALDLYREGYAGYIIVSGGQGKDEETAESVVMKDWLVKNGVPKDRIFEEDQSTSTYENFKLSAEIMEKQSFHSAVVVTNDFHIFRSLKIAEKLGIKATGAPAPAVKHLRAYSLFREVLSVVKTYLLDF